MSTNNTKYPMVTADGAPVPEKELQELCAMYNIPTIIGKMCFCLIRGTLYVKMPMLLKKGHDRGIQRVKIEREENNQAKLYRSTVYIYPLVDREILKLILQFPKELHKEMWEFYSAPTVGIGRTSLENVSNTLMHKFLPELSDTRGFARGLRAFAGIGLTSYEESSDVVLTPDELSDPKGIEIERTVTHVDRTQVIDAETVPEDPVVIAPAKQQPAQKPAAAAEPVKVPETPTSTPASAAPAAASPTAQAPTEDLCSCGHPWDKHFAQREKVGCFGCYKEKTKQFVCNITPAQLQEYKNRKQIAPAPAS